MTTKYPQAVALSATTHAVIIALILLVTYFAQRNLREPMMTFELVAGEGDNFEATEAPKLGTPEGLKAPEAPVQRATAPAPTPVAPPAAPIQTIPTQKAPSQVIPQKATPSPALSKADYDKLHPAQKQPTASKASTPKVQKIDTEGITKGVLNGSATNKTGGAGGKVLSRPDGRLMDAYYALFTSKLKEEIERHPGLSDSLTATLRVVINADGTLSNPQIISRSKSPEFDRAILEAVRRLKLRPMPEGGKTETIDVPINLKDLSAP